MVQDIECFSIEFERKVLVDRENTVDRGIQPPRLLSLKEVTGSISECSDRWCFKGAGIEPLCPSTGCPTGRCAGWVAVNRTGFIRITDKVGTFISSGVTSVGDIARC